MWKSNLSHTPGQIAIAKARKILLDKAAHHLGFWIPGFGLAESVGCPSAICYCCFGDITRLTLARETARMLLCEARGNWHGRLGLSEVLLILKGPLLPDRGSARFHGRPDFVFNILASARAALLFCVLYILASYKIFVLKPACLPLLLGMNVSLKIAHQLICFLKIKQILEGNSLFQDNLFILLRSRVVL